MVSLMPLLEGVIGMFVVRSPSLGLEFESAEAVTVARGYALLRKVLR